MALTNKTPEQDVEDLFDRISNKYDSMNNVITLGMHRKWREETMKVLRIQPGATVLDLCCGTGDWSIALAQAVGPTGQVYALDFSAEMLKIAEQKVVQAGLADRVTLIQGDAMDLPFPDDQFACVSIGFGLRNVPDAKQVLQEMQRVCQPEGIVACLETSQPEIPVVKKTWDLCFKAVPVLAKVFTDRYADYDYLQQTTKDFLTARQLLQVFNEVGLQPASYRMFFFGAAALHIGFKK